MQLEKKKENTQAHNSSVAPLPFSIKALDGKTIKWVTSNRTVTPYLSLLTVQAEFP